MFIEDHQSDYRIKVSLGDLTANVHWDFSLREWFVSFPYKLIVRSSSLNTKREAIEVAKELLQYRSRKEKNNDIP